MLKKTLKVAAGFCLMATTAFAQMPQLTELPVQKIAPAKLSLEQMKGNFEAVKMQRPAMRMNKVNLSDSSPFKGGGFFCDVLMHLGILFLWIQYY